MVKDLDGRETIYLTLRLLLSVNLFDSDSVLGDVFAHLKRPLAADAAFQVRLRAVTPPVRRDAPVFAGCELGGRVPAARAVEVSHGTGGRLIVHFILNL